jgi:hypothetical protein
MKESLRWKSGRWKRVWGGRVEIGRDYYSIWGGRVEDGREFEKEEWKLAAISTVFEEAEWNMEESLRWKSGRWKRAG